MPYVFEIPLGRQRHPQCQPKCPDPPRYYKAIVSQFLNNGVKLKMPGLDKPVFLHVGRIKPRSEFLKDPAEALKLEEEITVCVWKVERRQVEVGLSKRTKSCQDSSCSLMLVVSLGWWRMWSRG